MTAIWGDWMAAMLVHGSLLLIVVALFDLLFGRRVWPQLRSALWLLVLVRFVLPPHVSSPVGVAPAAATEVASPSYWLPLVWLVGVLGFGMLARRRLRGVRRLLENGSIGVAAPVRAAFARAVQQVGLRRAPRLLVSRAARNPAALGAWHAVVVVPADLPQDDLEHVLLHELMHVKRHDLRVQWLFSIVHLVYWFNPLLFLARRRAYTLREICCDAQVVTMLGPRAEAYRATLLRSARSLLVPGGAGFGYPASIIARLRWLQRGSGRAWLRRPITVAALLLAACTLLPGASLPVPVDALREARRAFAGALERGECTTLKYHMLRIHVLEKNNNP